MVKDYKNAKIYGLYIKIEDNVIVNKIIDIGSTEKTLKMRFQNHKCACKKKNSLLYRTIREDPLGFENYYIELIENYPCNNKKETIEKDFL